MSHPLIHFPDGKGIDPLWLKELMWPSSGTLRGDGKEYYTDFKGQEHPVVRFYDKQIEVIYSIENNIETVCVAGGWPLAA